MTITDYSRKQIEVRTGAEKGL